MSIGQRWPEVVDPPSFWRAEMPKREVILAQALSPLRTGLMEAHSFGKDYK